MADADANAAGVMADDNILQQGNQRWQTSPAAPPGGLGHSPTF